MVPVQSAAGERRDPPPSETIAPLHPRRGVGGRQAEHRPAVRPLYPPVGCRHPLADGKRIAAVLPHQAAFFQSSHCLDAGHRSGFCLETEVSAEGTHHSKDRDLERWNHFGAMVVELLKHPMSISDKTRKR